MTGNDNDSLCAPSPIFIVRLPTLHAGEACKI
jgi:hypothetical protein